VPTEGPSFRPRRRLRGPPRLAFSNLSQNRSRTLQGAAVVRRTAWLWARGGPLPVRTTAQREATARHPRRSPDLRLHLRPTILCPETDRVVGVVAPFRVRLWMRGGSLLSPNPPDPPQAVILRKQRFVLLTKDLLLALGCTQDRRHRPATKRRSFALPSSVSG